MDETHEGAGLPPMKSQLSEEFSTLRHHESDKSLRGVFERMAYSITKGEAFFLSAGLAEILQKSNTIDTSNNYKFAAVVSVPLIKLFGKLGKDAGLINKVENKKDGYLLGEYGEIWPRKYRGRDKKLNDGTIIRPGDLIYDISIARNLNVFEGMGPTEVSKELFIDFLNGMTQLAEDIRSGNFPQEVVALTGLSHLAGTKMSERMDFEIEDATVSDRIVGTTVAFDMKRKAPGEGRGLRDFKQKWHKTHRVWMTPRQVVENEQLFKDLRERYFK